MERGLAGDVEDVEMRDVGDLKRWDLWGLVCNGISMEGLVTNFVRRALTVGVVMISGECTGE